MDGIFLLVKLTTHDLWNPRMPEVSHAIELAGNSKTVLAIAWGGNPKTVRPRNDRGMSFMPRESNDAGAKSSLASSEDQRLVRARIALAISVVVYLSLAGLSAAWFPSYPIIPVALVAFGAHSAVYLGNPRRIVSA